MKNVSQKILAFVMIFVVLLSTMSFTVNMHYCGDTLVDTALFHKAKDCGMEMSNPSTEGCIIKKKNCCDDKQLSVEGQDELQQSVNKISFEQHLFITSFVYTYFNLFKELDSNVSIYEEYQPPLVIRQIYKIDETYLI
ncbi:hypothetical protein ACFS5J_02580 [Flavobacterium chuncheonense]|uniref:Secreted protein n=1 Tax=Flavobacterium chuncheonense TaxID=2026653 RepID=A0ABW5YIM9_9FLAO